MGVNQFGAKHDCGSCIFYSPHPSIAYRGQCRAEPPKLSFTKEAIKSVWPGVRETDFCGNHSVWE